MVSTLCFTSPVAVLYGFHARRKAPQRALAWIGLILSLITAVPFVLIMAASVMNFKETLCR